MAGMRRPLSIACALALGAISPGAAGVPSPGGELLTLGARSARTIEVSPVPGGVEVRDGDAAVVLERGTELHRVRATGTGWVAAGTSPTDHGRRLAIVVREEDGAKTLPPVEADAGPLRLSPAPLVDRGALAGIVWLEGGDRGRLGVWGATWGREGWGEPERVTGPGPGSQLALDAAVLPDGRWLAVWSAFDGIDDEILFSVRDERGWSDPTLLGPDNEVPDIVPALTAAPGGALVAWSRFDGHDYRLRVARWTGDGWTKSRIVGGPGSALPSWHGAERGAGLLFRELDRWTWLELDHEGIPVRRGSLPAPPEPRPVVIGHRGVVLAFPDGSRHRLVLEAARR